MAKSKKMSLPTLEQHIGFTQTVASSFLPVIKIAKIGSRAVAGITKQGSKYVSSVYKNIGN